MLDSRALGLYAYSSGTFLTKISIQKFTASSEIKKYGFKITLKAVGNIVGNFGIVCLA